MTSKYKLVPTEPTQEMIHAGQMAVSGFPRDVLERWQAMLTAAPQQEPEVGKLAEALGAILEMQERNYGNGMLTHIELIPLANAAREALAAYRKQGGGL